MYHVLNRGKTGTAVFETLDTRNNTGNRERTSDRFSSFKKITGNKLSRPNTLQPKETDRRIGEIAMPVFIWWKQGAILITKAAKYVVPGVIAGVGAIIGFIAGRKRKRGKEQKQ